MGRGGGLLRQVRDVGVGSQNLGAKDHVGARRGGDEPSPHEAVQPGVRLTMAGEDQLGVLEVRPIHEPRGNRHQRNPRTQFEVGHGHRRWLVRARGLRRGEGVVVVPRGHGTGRVNGGLRPSRRRGEHAGQSQQRNGSVEDDRCAVQPLACSARGSPMASARPVRYVVSVLKAIRERNLHTWASGYLRAVGRRWLTARPQGPRHLLFAVCDHFEPLWGRAGDATGDSRSARLGGTLPALGGFLPRCRRPASAAYLLLPGGAVPRDLLREARQAGWRGFRRGGAPLAP